MSVTTKHTFSAVGSGGQTEFTLPVALQLNNQDDLDVYVTKASAGIAANNNLRIKHFRQSTSSTLDANHKQIADTTGTYFPTLTHTGGTETLQNYQFNADETKIIFNSALSEGSIVSIERRTRDEAGQYTTFAGGSTIRHTDLNRSSTESNYTAQEARNKAFDLENRLFHTNFIPDQDDTIDLGSSTKQWKDLYVDGTAYLDFVNIGGGVIDNTAIGGSVPAAGTFTALTSSTTATVNDLVVTGTISDSGGNLELADDVNISGHLRFPDDKKIYLGNGDDASIDWDTDGWVDRLEITSAGDTQFKVGSGKYYSFFVDSALPLQIYGTYISPRVDIKPYPTNTVDLGKSDGQWKDLYVDGTGYIDTVSADTVNSTDITGAAIVTSGTSTSDTKVYSAKHSDALFLRQDSSELIKSGDTWSANDTHVATTSAIDIRIIDLVDDVGGFVPIANETSFPNANPDVNNPPGAGTIVSIGSLSQDLTSTNGGQITIANGTVGNSTVTITGAGSATTYLAGYGMLVETTSTLNTYTFHRLSSKATEVTTVAGNITNINAVANNATNINAVAGNETNINKVANISTDVTKVADIDSDVTAVAGDAADIGACSTNIGNIALIGSDLANNYEHINDYGSITGTVSSTSGTSNISTLASGSNLTDINTVAGKATEIGRLGTADAVADMNLLGTTAVVEDMSLLGTTACVADMALLGTADTVADMALLATTDCIADMAILATTDVVADLNTLGTADVVSDLNTLGTADAVSDMNTLAAISANLTTVATNNANVTICANSISNINSASTHAANALAYRDAASGILTQTESAPYNLAANNSTHTPWGDITDTGANAVFANETSNTLLTMSEGSSTYDYGNLS